MNDKFPQRINFDTDLEVHNLKLTKVCVHKGIMHQ